MRYDTMVFSSLVYIKSSHLHLILTWNLEYIRLRNTQVLFL